MVQLIQLGPLSLATLRSHGLSNARLVVEEAVDWAALVVFIFGMDYSISELTAVDLLLHFAIDVGLRWCIRVAHCYVHTWDLIVIRKVVVWCGPR